jgi:hypothetical protein
VHAESNAHVSRARFGDLNSYQNGGKGCVIIPDEIEQTVSEYAESCIDMRAGNARYSAM